MIIKMRQAVELSALYETIKGHKMPIKTAYKFNKLMKALEQDLAFYQTQVSQLLNEYAVRDAAGSFKFNHDGSAVKIVEGKQEECNRKLFDLLDLNVTVDGIAFKLEELDEIELTVSQLDGLMAFIVE